MKEESGEFSIVLVKKKRQELTIEKLNSILKNIAEGVDFKKNLNENNIRKVFLRPINTEFRRF